MSAQKCLKNTISLLNRLQAAMLQAGSEHLKKVIGGAPDLPGKWETFCKKLRLVREGDVDRIFAVFPCANQRLTLCNFEDFEAILNFQFWSGSIGRSGIGSLWFRMCIRRA